MPVDATGRDADVTCVLCPLLRLRAQSAHPLLCAWHHRYVSLVTKAGSTTGWRQLRRQVFALNRDETGRLWCWREDCRVQLTEHDRTLPTHATLGHVVSRTNGGTDELANLKPECARCNSRHGAAEGNAKRHDLVRNPSRKWSRF